MTTIEREATIPPPLPEPPAPLPPGAGFGSIYDALLKHPERLAARIAQGNLTALTCRAVAAAGATWLIYGLVVGSFSGGVQWWAAPAKLAIGSLVVAALCLPSLYVFGCLSGANFRFGQAVAASAACATMTTMMLAGFAPVAWVFSQSTDSVFFMGMLHLGFWFIGMRFGMRLLRRTLEAAGATRTDYLRAWILIFFLTSLQMTTALRPIIGSADTILTAEKRFFAVHWLETLKSDADQSSRKSR